MVMLLLSQGDIESNPGPNQRTSNYFPCSHWNVNSIMAHNKLFIVNIQLIMIFYQLMFILSPGLTTHITRKR